MKDNQMQIRHVHLGLLIMRSQVMFESARNLKATVWCKLANCLSKATSTMQAPDPVHSLCKMAKSTSGGCTVLGVLEATWVYIALHEGTARSEYCDLKVYYGSHSMRVSR